MPFDAKGGGEERRGQIVCRVRMAKATNIFTLKRSIFRFFLVLD
jgi:hypothetical protein